MNVLASGVTYVDLHFQGIPQVIATGVLTGAGGVALIDPGPSSSLPGLWKALGELGIKASDVTTILLTHIHLDHAGATGSLVAQNPQLRVFVHERGAKHMVDPARLLESARRLYGDRMETLWGEFLAVPAGNLVSLGGGERVDAGGRSLEVAYTPGHAWHHVSYFDRATGIAWVGDSCGGRIGTTSFVIPTTPPPDVDLEAWRESLDRMLAWSPGTLFLTHFGPSERPRVHIEELWARTEWASKVARQVLGQHPDPAEDQTAAAIFRQEMLAEIRRHMRADDALKYEVAVPIDQCYLGLARYWRKRGG